MDKNDKLIPIVILIISLMNLVIGYLGSGWFWSEFHISASGTISIIVLLWIISFGLSRKSDAIKGKYRFLGKISIIINILAIFVFGYTLLQYALYM